MTITKMCGGVGAKDSTTLGDAVAGESGVETEGAGLAVGGDTHDTATATMSRSDDARTSHMVASRVAARSCYRPASRERIARTVSEFRPPVLGLEHDLVTSGRAPASAPPPLRWERRCPASSHAATNEHLEIRERHAAALLFPDRAKREDRVERVVSVHA